MVETSQFDGLSFGTENTFEIMTWNLEEFPKADNRTVAIGAEIITELSCDVNAIQEISSEFYFNLLVEECNRLDSKNNWEGIKSSSWSYGLGFIYKSDRITIESVYEIFYDENRAFPREPFVLEGSIEGDSFVFINNHLKCCGNSYIDSIDIDMDGKMDIPDEDDEEARRQLASILLEQYIIENYTEEKVIVVGDLNDDIHESRTSNVFWNFIENSEQFKFVDMELAINGENGFQWGHWSYPTWPSHIDHILINENLFNEFENNNSMVITIRLEDYFSNGWADYEEDISDHRPVAWRFQF